MECERPTQLVRRFLYRLLCADSNIIDLSLGDRIAEEDVCADTVFNVRYSDGVQLVDEGVRGKICLSQLKLDLVGEGR